MTKKRKESNSENAESQPSTSECILVFDAQFLDDLTYWVETNRKTALRLLSLVEEIKRNPFMGTGKPEPLKYQGANIWSRRLTDADRIVYLVNGNRIDFLQARYHYSDR